MTCFDSTYLSESVSGFDNENIEVRVHTIINWYTFKWLYEVAVTKYTRTYCKLAK